MISQAELIPYQILDEPTEIRARIERTGSLIKINYFLWGQNLDLSKFSKAVSFPKFKNELWKDTCFEAFLQIPKEKAYLEMNFAPSGNYAFYTFDRYREGMEADHSISAPKITIYPKSNEWITVCVETKIPEPWASAPVLKVGMTTVLNQPNKELTYWSVKHRIDKPDFHDPVGFVLSLKSE